MQPVCPGVEACEFCYNKQANVAHILALNVRHARIGSKNSFYVPTPNQHEPSHAYSILQEAYYVSSYVEVFRTGVNRMV